MEVEELPAGWPDVTHCLVCSEPPGFCDHDRQIPDHLHDQYHGGVEGCLKRNIFCWCDMDFNARVRTVSVDKSALRKFHG